VHITALSAVGVTILKATKQTHSIDGILLKFLKECPEGIRLTDFEKILKGRLHSRGINEYYQVGSRHTIIEALKRLQKEGRAKKDVDSRRYIITPEGQQYLNKLEIVECLLSSNYWDSQFSWNHTSKEPELGTYNLVQADRTESGHSMALLVSRLQRLKMDSWQSWLKDVVDYAVQADLLDNEGLLILARLESQQESSEDLKLLIEKVRVIWSTIFKGVKRMMLVQYIDPQLMFDRIMVEISAK
jgi:DNA-binding PadR family transcriptional regulator